MDFSAKAVCFFPQQPMFSNAEALDAPRVAAWASEKGRLPAEHGGYFEGPGQRIERQCPTAVRNKKRRPRTTEEVRGRREAKRNCAVADAACRRVVRHGSLGAGQRGRASGVVREERRLSAAFPPRALRECAHLRAGGRWRRSPRAVFCRSPKGLSPLRRTRCIDRRDAVRRRCVHILRPWPL